MKVIVASRKTLGDIDDDFSHTLDGELVHLPGIECCSPGDCGCGRAFAGIASHGATCTAEVVERDLSPNDVIRAVAESLVDGGWFPDPDDPEAVATAFELVQPLLDLAQELPVGTAVRRCGDLVFTNPARPEL